MRIISRLIAAAFDTQRSSEEVVAMECVMCRPGPHDVLNAFDSAEARRDWQNEHFNKTGHRSYYEYNIRRVSVGIIAGK